MFNRNRKLKKEYDDQLRTLMIDTQKDWQRAKEIEAYLKSDYDQEVIVQRKIAESKHFYLYKEAKKRNLGRE